MTDIKPINFTSEDQTETTSAPSKPSPIESLSTESLPKPAVKKLIFPVLLLILAGTASGYGLHRLTQKNTQSVSNADSGGRTDKGAVVGIIDEETFRDTASGKLVAGGINGEGSHHLIREGGKSQYVYLTSSIIDLDQFIDRQVKVWGETFEAQKAGWLMDVGRLEILE